ncbi:MAG TPA: peptidoglycan-binding domain-containing protein, partial [Woeseiaceae bacterium]|nr:peptidoglycan-binding domain-containing protein [Woeseiaceae bacterium]
MHLQGRNLTERLQGDDVGLLHEELAQLGFIIDRTEVADKRFGTSTRDAVLAFQRQQRLDATGDVDENTARSINAEVDRIETRPSPEAENLIVRGHVLNPDGSPLASTIVRAFDKTLRAEQLLAETQTGTDGAYEVTYRRAQLQPVGKTAADLVVRAYDADGNELAHSGLSCHAPAKAIVDLVAGNVALRGPAEYDALVRQITPYLNDVALADFTRDDVDYLECSAKVDRVHLATLIVAHRLTIEADLPPWLFYALGRQGVRLQLPAMLTQSIKDLREFVERAIEANIVAQPPDPAMLNELLDRLQSVLKETAFPPADGTGRISVGDLLSASLVDRDVQEAFLSRYLAREGSLQEFWSNLEEDDSFNAAAREDLRFTLHLGMLTQYQLPLMQQLKALRKREELNSLRDLAGFARRRWRELLELAAGEDGVALPDDIPGQTPEERVNHYITSLREPIETLFPSDSLRHALKRAPDTSPTLLPFLANTPDLDLYWSNIDDYLLEHGDSAFAGIAEDQRAATVTEAKTVQRLLRVAPRADQVRILRSAGFDSAFKIARASKRQFKQRFVEVAEAMIDELDDAYQVLPPQAEKGVNGDATPIMLLSGNAADAVADTAFNQASGRAAAALHYIQAASELTQRRGPAAVWGTNEHSDEITAEFIKKNPTLESLFGSLSFCECEHCRSVYSPAAFLVDLLHWLEAPDENLQGDLHKAKGPIGTLLKRRPDLANIALTC